MTINGFGLKSGNTINASTPEKFRFLTKTKAPPTSQFDSIENGTEIAYSTLVADFTERSSIDLLQNNNQFTEEWQTKQFLIAGVSAASKVAEVLLLIDRVAGAEAKSGISLG